MARIRTIKPEFWTDEVIVALPFAARLLFIGLWNFADDHGALDFSPDRIAMQVFPGDRDADVSGMIDLLAAAGLVDYWVSDTGDRAIVVKNWSKHQKIDNPSRKTILSEGYRKLAIPNEVRRAVASKYGCQPGKNKAADCYYCGAPGKIIWWPGHRGRPSSWVSLSDLEFDHFIAEASGGQATNENMVLACRPCNRAKREGDPIKFMTRKTSLGVDSPRENSPLDLDQDQGPRTKEGTEDPREAREDIPSNSEFAEFWSVYPAHVGKRAAFKAFAKARTRAEHAIIVAGAQRYAHDPTRKPEFTKHPATWLNADCWLDEPAKSGVEAIIERMNGQSCDEYR